MKFFLIVVATLAVVLSAFPLWQKFSRKVRGSEFAIENLRFVEYEGGGVNSLPYQAGDEVFLSFDLENIPRNVSGSTDVVVTLQPLDPKGQPLKETTTSLVAGTEVHVPISYHLTLPLYALGGPHTIRIDVADRVSGRKIERTADFEVLGPQYLKLAEQAALGILGIRDHVFTETEGGPPMAEAAYRAGMKIRTGFNVVGFRLASSTSNASAVPREAALGPLASTASEGLPKNRMKLRVDMGILSSDGESLLDRPNVVAIDQDLFYPALYLPVMTSVRSPEEMPAGTYRMKYTLHDDVSGQVLSFEEPFTIH